VLFFIKSYFCFKIWWNKYSTNIPCHMNINYHAYISCLVGFSSVKWNIEGSWCVFSFGILMSWGLAIQYSMISVVLKFLTCITALVSSGLLADLWHNLLTSIQISSTS
jgi:hypothetical protein